MDAEGNTPNDGSGDWWYTARAAWHTDPIVAQRGERLMESVAHMIAEGQRCGPLIWHTWLWAFADEVVKAVLHPKNYACRWCGGRFDELARREVLGLAVMVCPHCERDEWTHVEYERRAHELMLREKNKR